MDIRNSLCLGDCVPSTRFPVQSHTTRPVQSLRVQTSLVGWTLCVRITRFPIRNNRIKGRQEIMRAAGQNNAWITSELSDVRRIGPDIQIRDLQHGRCRSWSAVCSNPVAAESGRNTHLIHQPKGRPSTMGKMFTFTGIPRKTFSLFNCAFGNSFSRTVTCIRVIYILDEYWSKFSFPTDTQLKLSKKLYRGHLFY